MSFVYLIQVFFFAPGFSLCESDVYHIICCSTSHAASHPGAPGCHFKITTSGLYREHAQFMPKTVCVHVHFCVYVPLVVMQFFFFSSSTLHRKQKVKISCTFYFKLPFSVFSSSFVKWQRELKNFWNKQKRENPVQKRDCVSEVFSWMSQY